MEVILEVWFLFKCPVFPNGKSKLSCSACLFKENGFLSWSCTPYFVLLSILSLLSVNSVLMFSYRYLSTPFFCALTFSST